MVSMAVAEGGVVRDGPWQVLAVDVGNTTTGFGLFAASAAAEAEPLSTLTLTTPARLTSDEAYLQAIHVLTGLCGQTGVPPVRAVLSCVVPVLMEPWRLALDRLGGPRPLVVGPGVRTGIALRYRDPSEVGSDRLADVLAARRRYGAPVIVVDFGTTMNIEVVDRSGTFAGGIIAPGLALCARALDQAAARLPMIEIRPPREVVGRSTREAMQSGVVLGEVARIDGLLDRVFGSLGYEAPVVVTGEYAGELAGLVSHEAAVDPTLTLRGLHQLALANPLAGAGRDGSGAGGSGTGVHANSGKA